MPGVYGTYFGGVYLWGTACNCPGCSAPDFEYLIYVGF